MQVKTRVWKDLSQEEQKRILNRSEAIVENLLGEAGRIIEAVRKRGDEALMEFSARFDGADLSKRGLRVREDEIEEAEKALSPELLKALNIAVENVTRFHRLQRPEGICLTETTPGIFAGERATAIPSAGLYVPHGKGSFPSMLYMLAVPARLAGVPRICVTTPPNPDGSVDPACLYVSKLCGVSEVYRVGGAQAVAALAVGTESIALVD